MTPLFLIECFLIFEPWHGISKNVVCASDQPAHTLGHIQGRSNVCHTSCTPCMDQYRGSLKGQYFSDNVGERNVVKNQKN